MKPVRVLIVEDSAVVREHLRRILSADPRLTVAGVAGSGEAALAIIDKVAPDVISMDIHLPGMEGFEATRQIMAHRPTPIVVVSGIGSAEVNLTMQALRAGALGVVEKPVAEGHDAYEAMSLRLRTQLLIMSEVKVVRRRGSAPRLTEVRAAQTFTSGNTPNLQSAPYGILAIGASTGGPNALQQLLTGLGGDFPLPVVAVQHMSPGFMEGFAEWLESVTPFSACVVNGPASLSAGRVYLATSNRHLIIEGCSTAPDDGPPVGNHRPSANVLFASTARSCGSSAIGVLLTGMGEDGATGLSDLRNAGGYTIAEDESTAVVYGMPAAGVRLGAVRELLPLSRIAPRVLDLVAASKVGNR